MAVLLSELFGLVEPYTVPLPWAARYMPSKLFLLRSCMSTTVARWFFNEIELPARAVFGWMLAFVILPFEILNCFWL